MGVYPQTELSTTSTVQSIPPAAGGFGGTVTLAGSGSTVQSITPSSSTQTTSSLMILGTTAATLVSSNSSRNYLSIRTANSTIYLQIGNNIIAPTTGVFNAILYGKDAYEINQQNRHLGQIQGISQDASSTIVVWEW